MSKQTETVEQAVERVKAQKQADQAARNARLAAARDAITAAADENSRARVAALEAGQAGMWAERAATAAAAEQRERALALIAWRAAGGTEDQFDEAWPVMRREQIQRRMMADEAATAAATVNWYRAQF